MALPCHPIGGAKLGRHAINATTALQRTLRPALRRSRAFAPLQPALRRSARPALLLGLAILTTAATWSLTWPAAQSTGAAGLTGAAALVGDARAASLSRSRTALSVAAATAVALRIDGLDVSRQAGPGDTVGDVLRAAGVELGPADRLSVPAAAAVVPGMRIILDRGLPVTLVDGGREYALRARPGTVAEFLGAAGISLGAQDTAVTPLDAVVAAGAVIRIDRVADREVVEVNAVPFTSRLVEDTAYDIGWSRVERAGENGQARQVFLVRMVNGVAGERVLVSSTELVAPVAEVRRIGARPRPAPAAPAQIEAIIRAAAAKHGADPQQLLRVAWCESRYNPSAYNGILGASGLFQIIPGTWAGNSVRAGYGGASVFDPVANANVAAWMFSRGQAGQWVCK